MWCSSHTCSQQKTMIGSSWPEVLTKQSVCLQRAFLTLTTLSESFQGAAQAAQGFSSQLATPKHNMDCTTQSQSCHLVKQQAALASSQCCEGW